MFCSHHLGTNVCDFLLKTPLLKHKGKIIFALTFQGFVQKTSIPFAQQ
jgi:hypothetical protein